MARSVVIKRYGDRRTIWLNESYLVQSCGVNANYLRVVRAMYKNNLPVSSRMLDILPDYAKSWRWARMDGVFYYDYDRVPNKAPNFYQDKLANETDLLRIGRELASETDVMAFARAKLEQAAATYSNSEVFTFYMFKTGGRIGAERAQILMQSWSYAKLLSDILKGGRWIQFGLNSKGDLFRAMAELLAEKQLEGMRIKNANGLRNKMADFMACATLQDEYAFFIHGGHGNTNALVVGSVELVDELTGEVMVFDVHQTLIYNAFMNRFNAGKEFKQSLYNKYYLPAVARLGVTPISYRTFSAHTNRYSGKMKIGKARHGYDYFNKKFQTYVPAKPLEYGGSMWVMDGSGLKLAYNRDGKPATLYMLRVFDVASGLLLGHSVADHHQGAETKTHVLKALQMALKTSGGYGAMEVLTDNGGAFQEMEVKNVFGMLFARVRTIKPGNSQENPAEMFVRLMNDLARQFDNWAGQFNAHCVEFKSNTDDMKVKNLPTKHEAYTQAMQMVEQWNSQIGVDGLSRMERFNRRHPELKPLDPKVLRYINGHITTVDLSRMRGFVNVEHKGVDYKFTIAHWETELDNMDRKLGYTGSLIVQVRWDEVAADLYTPDGVYLLTCNRTEKAHKSAAEATSKSGLALRELSQRKQDMLKSIDNWEAETARSLQSLASVLSQRSEEHDAVGESLDYGMLCLGRNVVKDVHNAQGETAVVKNIEKESFKPSIHKKTVAERALEEFY